ncbi:MAG: DNA polymerase III subunit beta [Acidimicrobiales bacterium]|nr:DNA polymerase III subunit beta [Acidimicrobiales bacterium]
MKFRCERDALVEALGMAGRAVSTRGGTLTALTGIRAELTGDRLSLTGTDLELTITVDIEVNGEADGVVVLPAKLTLEIVRALEAGAVQVSVGDEEAEIVAGSATFSVLLLAPEGFPQQQSAEAEPVSVPTSEFAGAVRQVVRAASRDETRSVALTGVLLAAEADGLRLVATDSYRLALRDLPGLSLLTGETQVIVPARALSELVRLLGDAETLEVRLDDNTASFTVGRAQVITRLIDAEYPNYRGLIPTSQPNELTVGHDALLEAVRRVGLMVQSTPTPIRLVSTSDQLELLAITPDRGEAREAMPAKYDGDDLTVAFNPEYLLDGIEATSGDEIKIQTVDGLKPALLRSNEDEGFLYLLMPVRVS